MSRTTITAPSIPARPIRPPRRAEKIGFALACLFAAACLVGMVYLRSMDHTLPWDFEAFYVAGTILRAVGPARLYDVALQQHLSAQLYPGQAFLSYYHTPLEALLFWPLAALPFRLALLVWTALSLAALGLFLAGLRYTGRRLHSPFHFAFSFVVFALVTAVLRRSQDTLLLLPILLGGLLLLERGRETAAGAVLGLGLYRFEVMLPLLAIFALRRRWRLVAGAAVVAALGLLASWALVGTAGLRAYVHVLLMSGQVHGGWGGVQPPYMPNLRGLLVVLLGGLLPPRLLLAVIVLASAALLLWAARECRGLDHPADPRLPLHYSIAITAALLASYHLLMYTLVPLIVVVFLDLAYCSEQPGRLWWKMPSLLLVPLLLLPHAAASGLVIPYALGTPLLGMLLALLARRARRLVPGPAAP
jgi:hypothetical protein